MLGSILNFKQYISIFAIAFALGTGAGIGGVYKLTKAFNPEIKLECPACPEVKCADCNCPPSNGIEFDKIKNAKGLVIHNHQYLVMQRDTLSLNSLEASFRKILNEQKIAKCR